MQKIMFDAVTEGPSFDSPVAPTTSTQTVAHATASQRNRIMVIDVSGRSFTVWGAGTITNVTYNGKAATSLGFIQSPNGNNAVVQTFYVLNPDVGTFNVSITTNARARAKIAVRTYYNVNQTNPFRTASLGSGATTPASLTPVSAVDDLVVDAVAVNGAGTITGPATGQTQRYLSDISLGGGPDSQKATHAGSDKPGTASTTSMSWTITNGKDWAMLAAAMIPAMDFYLID